MLERQIMFKKLQGLQRQKKLQELNDSHQRNVIHNNHSSVTQYGLIKNGVPVRDSSQMFMFGDTNSVHGLPNSQAQNQVLSEGLHIGGQTLKVKQESGMEYVNRNQDLDTLDPLEQKILFNVEDNNRMENMFESGSWSALMQSAVAEVSNGDLVKKEDCEKWSSFEVKPGIGQGQGQQVASLRRQPNVWVDVHVPMMQQNPPSTSYAPKNRKMETGFGEGSSKMHPRGNNHGPAVLKKPTLNYDSSTRVKKERVDYDHKVNPLTSACGNYKSQPVSSSIYLKQQYDVAKEKMVVLKSKKRKVSTFEQLHDTSRSAEVEWAHSVNRIPEKVTDSLSIVDRKRRRLILTTQLMQLLFKPAPKVVISEDANKHFDIITYHVAKLGLNDACRPSRSNCDNDLFKTVEGFIDRSKRLEDMLSRFEKGEGESSIVDVKVEFQDLDKFSVINRFAKFHSRGPLVTTATSSSGGGSDMQKLNPQRYVTASEMPSIVPEGRYCLLLG